MRSARDELQAFAVAVRFLTRLPAPARAEFSPERLAASVRYRPLVGTLVGGFCAGVFWLADIALPGTVALLLALAGGLIITGSLHEDGLADTFDGIGTASHGGAAEAHRDRMLDVMRDSRLGTFGALALVVALGLKIAALAGLPPHAVCLGLVAGHGLSRLSCVVAMQTSTYVRERGVATPFARRLGLAAWLVVLLTGLALLAGLSLALGPLTASLALPGLIAGHALMRLGFERKLGGYTGDTLGAVQQASEIGLYVGVCAGMGAWASSSCGTPGQTCPRVSATVSGHSTFVSILRNLRRCRFDDSWSHAPANVRPRRHRQRQVRLQSPPLRTADASLLAGYATPHDHRQDRDLDKNIAQGLLGRCAVGPAASSLC